MPWLNGIFGIASGAAIAAQQQAQVGSQTTTLTSQQATLGTTAGGLLIANGSNAIQWNTTKFTLHGDLSDETIDSLFQNPRFLSHIKKLVFNEELKKIVNDGNE